MYEQIKSEAAKLNQDICKIQQQLIGMPKGSLQCKKNGKYPMSYHWDQNSLTYLNKKHRWLAEKLAVKKYLTLLLSEKINEKESLEAYLSTHHFSSYRSDALLNPSSAYSTLLKSYFTPTCINHQEWMQAPYERNPKYPDHLIHKCISGNYVRSKSETIIDLALYLNKIPYRYECELILDNITYYPDFMLLHPKTDMLYYWEHFGMFDDADYINDALMKLQNYAKHGIIPNINLITTYETKDNPFTLDMAEKIIQFYFS